MTDLSAEKLNHLARFISLLTGELDVRVVSSDAPEPNAVVLPVLDNLDDESVDVLYGLCLREAGYMAKSRKTVNTISRLETEFQLKMAMASESARIERFLIRKFGGGAEILEEHYTKHASNPRFAKIVLGVNPSEATAQETFVNALKWTLLGCPRWGWNKLFPSDHWEASLAVLRHDDFADILSMPARKFEDSVELAQKAVETYLRLTKTVDTSVVRSKTQEQNAWEKAMEKIHSELTGLAEAAKKKEEAGSERIKELSEKIAAENERIFDDANPLRERLAQERSEMRTYNRFNSQLNQLERVDRQRERLDGLAEKMSVRAASLNEKMEKAEESAEERMKRMEERAAALQQKINHAQQRFDERSSRLNEKLDALQKRELDVSSQLQKESLSEKKKASLEERLQDLMKRIQEMQDQIAKNEKEHNEKMQSLQEKSDAQEKASADRLDRQDARLKEMAEKVAERSSQMASLVKQRQILNDQQQKLEAEMKQMARESGMSSSQAAEMVEKMQQLRQNIDKNAAALEKIEEKYSELRKERSALQKQMSDQRRTDNWEMEKQMRSIEQELGKQGIEMNLTEKMVEMEGWDAANQAQANFDSKLSNEYKMSVINGQGGGRGTRDVMLNLNDFAAAVEDVDPNVIFADVARLSPLSGFSESGVREADDGKGNAKSSKAASMVALNKTKHTVWSKRFDKIVNAPTRSVKVVSDLRKTYAKEIAAMKKTFMQHLKPSFKAKHVGGREEGDLDARNIWKLAANQGSDFFEVIQKRPNNKAAASILVDLSGSVASWGKEGNEVANEKLRSMVLMLSEGLSAVNMPHEILGFYAPMDPNLSSQSIPATYNRKACRLETVVVKNFKDKDLSGLASLSLQQAENSDGESLRIATERLMKQQGQSKMLFMISDGKPYMQDANVEILDNDLRSAFMEAVNKKVVVTCLGLASEHAVLGDAYISLDKVTDLPNVVKEVLTKP